MPPPGTSWVEFVKLSQIADSVTHFARTSPVRAYSLSLITVAIVTLTSKRVPTVRWPHFKFYLLTFIEISMLSKPMKSGIRY